MVKGEISQTRRGLFLFQRGTRDQVARCQAKLPRLTGKDLRLARVEKTCLKLWSLSFARSTTREPGKVQRKQQSYQSPHTSPRYPVPR